MAASVALVSSLPAQATVVTISASGTYTNPTTNVTSPRAATAKFIANDADYQVAYAAGSVGATPYAAGVLHFDCSGGVLCIELQNSLDIPGSTADDAVSPPDILTGVFFDLMGLPPAPTKLSATAEDPLVTVGPGAATVAQPGTNVGAAWAFKYFTTPPASHAGNFGIAASGLGGTFGSGDLFCTPGGPSCPLLPNGNGGTTSGLGGVNFGILPVGDVLTTGTGGFNNNDPYQKNKAIFRVGNLNLAGFNASWLSNVSFQYGSALDEGIIPEPGVIALLGMGMVALGAWSSRRRAGRA